MIKLIIVGYFVIKFIDLDYDNKYNIPLENKSGVLITDRLEEKPLHNEGDTIYLKTKANCELVYEVREAGNRGPWAPEDNYFVHRKNHICTVIKDEHENTITNR